MSRYNISTKDQYNSIYQDSVNNPEDFWSDIASKNFVWKNKWEDFFTRKHSIDEVKQWAIKMGPELYRW